MLSLAYYGIHSALTKWEIFTISSIEITGNENLETEFLANLSIDFLDKNLFAISKDDVLKKYENIIRISDIKVSRVIPNKLQIRIIEKTGKFYIKTVDGDIFPIDKNKEILDNNYFISENLPVITTNIATEYIKYGDNIKNDLVDRIYSYEAELRKISPDFADVVSEYFIRNNEIFIIEAHIGYQIVFGSNNLEEKIKYYQIIEQNRTFEANTIIDLRYEDQLVIRSEGL